MQDLIQGGICRWVLLPMYYTSSSVVIIMILFFLLLLDMLKDPAYINSYRINNAEHTTDSTSWNDDNYRLLVWQANIWWAQNDMIR